jgi:hypothetical protein
MFGWKGDALQRAMDSPCYVNCPTLKTQSMSAMNQCSVPKVVDENYDGCTHSSLLPGSPLFCSVSSRKDKVIQVEPMLIQATPSHRAQGTADGVTGRDEGISSWRGFGLDSM